MFSRVKKMGRNKKGFTLVEIMTVVALIAILFVIFVPRLDFATNKVRESGLQSDFRSYQLAFEQVARQNSGFNTITDIKTGTPTKEQAQALAKAINSYLDKKLQIEVNDSGEMTLGIDDPWKEGYIFKYDATNDAVYVISKGPDKSCTDADILADLGKTDLAEGNLNADNYSISVSYDVAGLTIKTTGFDNNIDR